MSPAEVLVPSYVFTIFRGKSMQIFVSDFSYSLITTGNVQSNDVPKLSHYCQILFEGLQTFVNIHLCLQVCGFVASSVVGHNKHTTAHLTFHLLQLIYFLLICSQFIQCVFSISTAKNVECAMLQFRYYPTAVWWD